MLATVALLWGASFLFIKVAVRELAPATLILGRLGLASVTLAVIVPVLVGGRRTVSEIRAHAGWLIVVGLRLTGVGIGFVGVALLVGAQPHGKVLGALAVCGMAFCYAVGQLLVGRHLRQVQPSVVALATTAVAAIVASPFGIAQAPGQMPGWKTVGSVVALAVPLTAIAFLLFYAIIAGAGAAYASLVTYLVPPIALAYGAIFLSEHFGAADFAALVLILGGVVLGTGRIRLRRRALASEA